MEDNSNASKNLAALEIFFSKSLEHFDQACKTLKDKSSFYFSLANKQLVIHSAGKSLQETTCQALKHIEISSSPQEVTSLEIFVWDEKESGINLPIHPWETPTDLVEDSFVQFNLAHYFVSQYDNQSILYIFNQQTNQAICILKDATTLNNSFISSPYFKIIAIWASKQKLNILHAGCVSIDNKAVLIVGRSGKGKSSTSVQCLIGGLNYLSDDYVLVDWNGENPIAYSLFNTGKLKNKHIERFNKIQGEYKQGILDKNNKPLLFLYPLFKDKIRSSAEIKAIIVPNITSEIKASYHSISAAESLRALAPSTLIQLKINNLNQLNSLAKLTRTLPNYELNIGSDLEDISLKVKEIIDSL
jgi:hypothetical protein